MTQGLYRQTQCLIPSQLAELLHSKMTPRGSGSLGPGALRPQGTRNEPTTYVSQCSHNTAYPLYLMICCVLCPARYEGLFQHSPTHVDWRRSQQCRYSYVHTSTAHAQPTKHIVNRRPMFDRNACKKEILRRYVVHADCHVLRLRYSRLYRTHIH